MSFSEFANNLRQIITKLNDTREEESVLIAIETVALVRRRVQNDKEDSEGNTFDGYSQALVPQWMLYSSATSDGAIERLKDGDWFQSYEDLKIANNQPVDAKNYTNTGDMWRNTGVTSIESTNNSTIVSIGGQTTRANNIHGWTLERDDVLLIAPNEQERFFITESHNERIFSIFSEVFQ